MAIENQEFLSPLFFVYCGVIFVLKFYRVQCGNLKAKQNTAQIQKQRFAMKILVISFSI